MTSQTRTLRTLLSNALRCLTGFIMVAALLVIGYQALFGDAPVLSSLTLIVLAILLYLWRGSPWRTPPTPGRGSKPLTLRWQAHRRARRASK